MPPLSNADIIGNGFLVNRRSSIRLVIDMTTSLSFPGLHLTAQMLGSSTLGKSNRFGTSAVSVAVALDRPYRSLSNAACFSASICSSCSLFRSSSRCLRSSVSAPAGRSPRSSWWSSAMNPAASASSSSSPSSSSSSTSASSSMN